MIIPWLLLQFQVLCTQLYIWEEWKTQAEGNLWQFLMAIWDSFGFILWSLSITNSWSLIFWVHKLGILYTSPWKVESAQGTLFEQAVLCSRWPGDTNSRRSPDWAQILARKVTITEFMDSTLQCVFLRFFLGFQVFRQAPIIYQSSLHCPRCLHWLNWVGSTLPCTGAQRLESKGSPHNSWLFMAVQLLLVNIPFRMQKHVVIEPDHDLHFCQVYSN